RNLPSSSSTATTSGRSSLMVRSTSPALSGETWAVPTTRTLPSSEVVVWSLITRLTNWGFLPLSGRDFEVVVASEGGLAQAFALVGIHGQFGDRNRGVLVVDGDVDEIGFGGLLVVVVTEVLAVGL